MAILQYTKHGKGWNSIVTKEKDWVNQSEMNILTKAFDVGYCLTWDEVLGMPHRLKCVSIIKFFNRLIV